MLLTCQLELLYLFPIKNSLGLPAPHFRNFFIIHHRKKMLNQKDVEFDFNIGHALLLFPFL